MPVTRPPLSSTLSGIREGIADRGLIGMAVLAPFGVAASLARIPVLGWSPLMTVHLIVATTVIAAAMARTRLSYRMRAGLMVGTFIALGLAGALNVGLLLGPQMFLVGAGALAFLLFGQAAGIAVLLASLAITGITYALATYGWIQPAVDPRLYLSSATAWITNGATIVIVVLTIGATTEFILRGFIRSGDLTREQNDRLERQMVQLVQMQSALENANQSMCIFDVTAPGLPIVQVNGAFERVFGYRAAEALGRSIRFLHGDDHDQPGLATIRAATQTGHGCTVVIRNYRKDGSMFWAEVRIAPVRNNEGRVTSYVSLINDVTQRQAAENATREQQKLEAIGTLAGGLAHDFNNLLGVIIGNLDLLAETYPGNPRAAEALAAALRASEVTHALLGVAQRQALNVETLDLNAILRQMLPLIKASVGGEVTVCTSLAPVPLMARIDSGGFMSVILNLVINACDAMRDSGRDRVLTLGTQAVRIEAGNAVSVAPGLYAMLQVADTGAGMSDAVKSSAFDPFFTTKSRHASKGLGLATVYGYVEQLDGKAVIESSQDVGTTVSLYLPLDSSRSDAVFPAAIPGQGGTRPAGRPRVLVVDDEDGLREIACAWLESLGFETSAASSARTALQRLSESRFDIIFTDVVMPGGMNGVELAREAIRAQPGLRAIITSGYSESTRGRNDLPGPFLRKPYRKKDLEAVFRQAGTP